MAVKDSNEIPVGNMYVLGDYHFALERTSVPGSTNDKIEAICTKLNESKSARKSIQVPSGAKIAGWYVEANGDTADVYAMVEIPDGDKQATADIEAISSLMPIPCGSEIVGTIFNPNDLKMELNGAQIMTGTGGDGQALTAIRASSNPNYGNHSFTYNNKTVYITYATVGNGVYNAHPRLGISVLGIYLPYIAWAMVYGTITQEYKEKEMLIGRFKIELEDAGGVGPGSDWVDPGDYDPDWEEGDPTHTLYVTVTGALSGRHNDPIVNPSYSYIPADKDTVKDYGCGGDGGHGGGGGAGASTVVVHKFATNQANSKEVTTIARRHGYGSGGGKGGKGGDGCILVYY